MVKTMWPSSCPCCGSRKVLVYVEDGSFACLQCGVDNLDIGEVSRGACVHSLHVPEQGPD